MRLENWSVTYSDVDPYQAPETIRPKLQGYVFGNPLFNDGDFVITSSIIEVDGNDATTRSGSVYTLGTVNPGYGRQFPNALEMLKN